jgi:hypothetical protein
MEFFFFPWQSRVKAAAEPSSASIKQRPRNLRNKVMENIPSQVTVVNFAKGKVAVD